MNFSYSPNDHTKLLSLVAKAIDKGIGRDIKDTLADNNKETNNNTFCIVLNFSVQFII